MDKPTRTISPNDEDYLEVSDKVRQQADSRAMQNTQELRLPLSILLPESVENLGATSVVKFRKIKESLTDNHNEQLQHLIGLANAFYWFAAWRGACWMDEARLHGIVGDTSYLRGMCDAQGYIDIEGGSWTLYNELANNDKTLLKLLSVPFGFNEVPDDQEILDAIACLKLSEANDLAADGKPIAEVMDIVWEAFDARDLSGGILMWKEAEKCAHEDLATDPSFLGKINSERGKIAAKARDGRYQPIREKAYQLAKQRAPSNGAWPSRRQAVLAIMDDVKTFAASVVRGGLSEQQAAITIDSWLKEMPEAEALFTGKRIT